MSEMTIWKVGSNRHNDIPREYRFVPIEDWQPQRLALEFWVSKEGRTDEEQHSYGLSQRDAVLALQQLFRVLAGRVSAEAMNGLMADLTRIRAGLPPTFVDIDFPDDLPDDDPDVASFDRDLTRRLRNRVAEAMQKIKDVDDDEDRPSEFAPMPTDLTDAIVYYEAARTLTADSSHPFEFNTRYRCDLFHNLAHCLRACRERGEQVTGTRIRRIKSYREEAFTVTYRIDTRLGRVVAVTP